MKMGRSARRIVGLGAILVGFGLVGAKARSSGAEQKAPRSANAAESTEGSSASASPDLRVVPQPTVPVRVFRPGARYSYTYKSLRTFRMQQNQGAPTRFALRLEGTLALTVVADDGGSVHLQGMLRDAHLTSEGASLPTGVDDHALARPFFVTLERAGRVSGMLFEKSVGGEVRNQLKSVIASMQFVAPSQPELQDWTVAEQDSAGEYLAAYDCKGSLPTVKKSKLRYTRLHTANGLAPVSEIGSYEVASRGAFALEQDGWFRTVDDDETVTVTLPEKSGEYIMVSKTSATLVGLDEAPSLVGALERAAPSLEMTSFDLSDQLAAAAAEMDAKRVAGATFRSILAELKALSPTSRDDLTKAHASVSKLGAVFRVDPKAAREARDALLREPADERA
ncbi:MAG TPA: hypothetical protein VM580_27890 [Labilithrix sp.]|nr:hypothetical protein [Labilithrix sp.]